MSTPEDHELMDKISRLAGAYFTLNTNTYHVFHHLTHVVLGKINRHKAQQDGSSLGRYTSQSELRVTNCLLR